MSISGYSHKQQTLLRKLIAHLFNFEFCEKRFEMIKEQNHRNLKNFKADQPYDQAYDYTALILSECAWSNQELLDAFSCEFLFEYFKFFLTF